MPPKKKKAAKWKSLGAPKTVRAKAKPKTKPKAKAKPKATPKVKVAPKAEVAPKKKAVAKKKGVTVEKPIADIMKRTGITAGSSPKEPRGVKERSAGATERQPAFPSDSRALTSVGAGKKEDRAGQRAFATASRTVAAAAFAKNALAAPKPPEKKSDLSPIFSSQGKEIGKGKGYPVDRVGKRQVYVVVFENGNRERAFKVGDKFVIVGR